MARKRGVRYHARVGARRARQHRMQTASSVDPGRLYTLPQFLVGAALLVGLTVIGLWIARRRRVERDARMTAALGDGWRFTSQVGLDLPDPFVRFSCLTLTAINEVREGQDEGFDVAYFVARLGRRSPVTPHVLVQLPTDPPRLRYVADNTPDLTGSGWGPRAEALLRQARGVIVETGPMAVLVRSKSAPAETVRRLALDLARAVTADAEAGHPPSLT